MNPLPEGESPALGPGEAYERCMRELGRPYPDYVAAQIYATLSLEETVRDVVAQLAQLAKELVTKRLWPYGATVADPGKWRGAEHLRRLKLGVRCSSLSLRNHLAVRDILRTDPDLREQHAAVKRRFGAATANVGEYGRGKNAMVQQILAAAGLTDAERYQPPFHTIRLAGTTLGNTIARYAVGPNVPSDHLVAATLGGVRQCDGQPIAPESP